MLKRLPLIAILLVVGLVGCNKSAPNPGTGGSTSGSNSADTGKKLRIAVIPKGTGHQFWKSVEAGAQKAAAENNVEIVFKGPTGEGATADQIKMVENAVVNGFDGICLAPLDGKALRTPVKQAIDEKIPVVIFDSGLEDSTGITSFVATNNYRAGQVAGEHLAKLLGEKGKVILIRYQLNSASTEAREKGFLDAIGKHKQIELLSDLEAGADEAKAVERSESQLLKFGDQVDGIFCPNESTASGMLTALERAGKGLAGKVKFVGFDSSENLIRGMKDGHLNAVVVQNPVQMGYDAVRVMVEKLRGKSVPDKIEVPETLATTENMDDPKVSVLLHPKKAD
jgi:ribose transport system substrate-binding protein